jgi:hypothetical protein
MKENETTIKKNSLILKYGKRAVKITHETQMRIVLTINGFVYGMWISWMLCGQPV